MRQKPGHALAVIVASHLLVVLDASVVNIALPSIQADLGMADASRQWAVTGYSLAFGGLLLPGGRIADALGRKKTFLIGLAGFTVASVVGGLATGETMLLIARALQGMSAAFLAPAGLAILSTVFPEGRARAKAFAVFGAAAGSGGIVGTVLGGVLTSYGSWRWCLLINLPLGLAFTALAARFLRESTSARPARFDLAGAVTATLGTGSLLYGITNSAAEGRLAPATVGFTLAGIALLAGFVLIERRADEPMMPLRIVADRVRGSAFAIILLVNGAAYAFYLLLTFYLQAVLDYSPLATGVAFVPMGIGVLAGAAAAGRALGRWDSRRITVVGLALAAAAMGSLAPFDAWLPFWALMLPAQLLIGAGIGAVLTTIVSLALQGVSPGESGVASGLTNAMREVGGATGISALNVVVISVTSVQPDPGGAAARSTGYMTAFLAAAALLAAALVIALVGTRARQARPDPDEARASEGQVRLAATEATPEP